MLWQKALGADYLSYDVQAPTADSLPYDASAKISAAAAAAKTAAAPPLIYIPAKTSVVLGDGVGAARAAGDTYCAPGMCDGLALTFRGT